MRNFVQDIENAVRAMENSPDTNRDKHDWTRPTPHDPWRLPSTVENYKEGDFDNVLDASQREWLTYQVEDFRMIANKYTDKDFIPSEDCKALDHRLKCIASLVNKAKENMAQG